MTLEIDRIQKLPGLNIGDIKNDVESCKLRVITSSWTFPIRTSLSKEEIDITIGITPYNEIATGQLKPATLELQKQDIKEKFVGKMVTISSFPLLYFK